MSVNKICVICGTQFQTEIFWEHLRDTCSEKCRYELVSKKLSNTEFIVVPSSQKICCSPTCRKTRMSRKFSKSNNPNWKETKKIRPSSKRTLRQRIKERDRVCQDCRSTKYLQVHHLDSNPSNNSEGNLILLCKFCHSIRHENIGESNLTGLILANRTYSKLGKIKYPICEVVFQPKRRKTICCSPKCGAILGGITRRR